MPLIRCERPALRCAALNPAFPGPKPSLSPEPAPAFTFMVLPNNNLFQEFMRTFIKRVPAPAASATLVEARDNSNRLFKPWNPNLYYNNLHMDCYYFCQQYKDHFKKAKAQKYKRILLLRVL